MNIGRGKPKRIVVAGLALCCGCGGGPSNFRKIQHPAPLVRARAIGLGDNQPDSRVIPALVTHLGDSDPVVRLAAHEELRRRTGRDFGFVPWEAPAERAGAIERWRNWLKAWRPTRVDPSTRRATTPSKGRPSDERQAH